MREQSGDTTRLAAFLTGDGRDHAGRSFEDVLAFDDAALERRHDFIQWLFPLPEPSLAVPSAPVLTPDDLAALKASPKAQARLRQAAERMAAFYAGGLHWRTRHDHNHLRITRIIRSLRLILGDGPADAFKQQVLDLARGAPIDAAARRYWDQA
ncbi:MAG: opioid growth factor receptor-related protein [Caulobacteraceae bacterium]